MLLTRGNQHMLLYIRKRTHTKRGIIFQKITRTNLCMTIPYHEKIVFLCKCLTRFQNDWKWIASLSLRTADCRSKLCNVVQNMIASVFTCVFDMWGKGMIKATWIGRHKRSGNAFFTYLCIFITHTHKHHNLITHKPCSQNMHQHKEQNKSIDIYMSASRQKATSSIS